MPELTFDDFAYGGEAVGRLPEGKMCFVRGGIPGERAKIEITGEKRSFARGKIVGISTPSPERIAPECPLFADGSGRCPLPCREDSASSASHYIEKLVFF